MNQLWVRPLRPAERRAVNLVGKDAHSDRDRNVRSIKKRQFVFPIETGRRDCRARQPEKGDGIEHIVSGQTCNFAVKSTRDELQTARVVVEHPGGQADGRIHNSVQRLWTESHLECVRQAFRKEVFQQLELTSLVVGETSWSQATGLDRL